MAHLVANEHIKKAIILIHFLFIININADQNLLCMTQYSRTFSNLTLSNNFEENTFDCISNIKNGSKMFTVISPNELFLVNSDDIYVFGDFRLNENAFDKNQSTVVLATEKVNPQKLNGLKYCHPGGNVTTPPWVTNEFITTILNNARNDINIQSNQTLLDYSYFVLNSTLGPSCLQNIWSDDENLKQLYPKLFELCPHYNSEYNSYQQSLRCLINGGGNIAVTSLEMVHELENEILSQPKEFLSFCKNNTWQGMNNPCIWRTTSWPVLIGNRNYTDRLPEITQTLKYFTSFPNGISISNYTKGFNENAVFEPSNDNTFSSKNKRILSWCTLTQEEYENCVLLQKIFSFYDIHTKINSCVKVKADYLDKYECINNMNMGSSSVTFLHSDHLFTAKRANLKVALYADTGLDVIKSILFVNTTNIKTIDDLQNKKGCFSEYGSIDWLSFVSAYKRQILQKSCFYDEELSKFLNDSCMPGVKDDIRRRKESVDVERLCRICEASSQSPTAVNCNPDQYVNIFATSNGAIDCLMKSVGQFAVIRIDNNYTISSDKIEEGIKVMCKNGTLLDFDKIDDNCYLSITPYGGIVTKKELAGDVKLAFLQLKAHNLQYGWLPNDYISNLFKNIFPITSITEFLSVDACNNTVKNVFCDHILELDRMLVNADTCVNNILETRSTDATGLVIGTVLLCLVLLGMGAAYFLYRKYKNNANGTENNNKNETENNNGNGNEIENENENKNDYENRNENEDVDGNETERDPLNRQN